MKLVSLLLAALFAGAQGGAAASPNDTLAAAAADHDATPFSTRMLSSIMLRQQGLVSSGQATSTLESGLISLALQSWLSLYASSRNASHDEGLRGNFSDYVDAILASLSTQASFTNVTQTALLPLDRLTVAQYVPTDG